MKKTYTINGKEIKMDYASPQDMLTQLLEVLDEKKEDCKHSLMKHLYKENGDIIYSCDSCGKHWPFEDENKKKCVCSNYKRGQTRPVCPVCDKKEEPKSTLREEIASYLWESDAPNTNIDTDKIISLFKDTLLKEIKDKETRLNPFSEREEIINLIKNL